MGKFAYRWADGSVTICVARNREEAASLLDEIADADPRCLVQLKSPIMITLRPTDEGRWTLDSDGMPMGEQILNELEEQCYPAWIKVLMEIYDEDWNGDPANLTPKMRERLRIALEEDALNADLKVSKGKIHPEAYKFLKQFRRKKN